MARCLVTGASGFIGSHMVEVLKNAGHEVRATDHPAALADTRRGRYGNLLQEWGVEVVPASLDDPHALKQAAESVEFCFHTAAIFDYLAPWDKLVQVNVEGTRHLLNALADAGNCRRLVLWGAGGIYDPGQIPITEQSPIKPSNPYLKSKWMQEELVAQDGRIPYSVVRPMTVYGPRGVYGGGQMLMSVAAMNKISIPKSMTGRIPFVHAEDVARAALFIAERADTVGEAYNLVDDVPYTTVDYMRLMSEITGKPLKLLPPIPVGLLTGVLGLVAKGMLPVAKVTGWRPPLEPDSVKYMKLDFWVSNQKLKDLGYRFVYPDARHGILQTLAWYQEQGWLSTNLTLNPA